MAPHSSTVAWKIPWTEESGGLQSMARKESPVTEHKKQNCQEKNQKAGPEFEQESRFSNQLTGNTEDKEHATECYRMPSAKSKLRDSTDK